MVFSLHLMVEETNIKKNFFLQSSFEIKNLQE
jgi:hypothetical protein